MSKVYVESLHKRIQVLEDSLQQQKRASPETQQEPSPPAHEDVCDETHESPTPALLGTSDAIVVGLQHSNDEQSPDDKSQYKWSPDKEDTLSRILSTSGSISSQESNGYIRYFGHNSPLHVFSDPDGPPCGANLWEQKTRAELVVRSISKIAHDYLMDLFWTNYNSVLHVVHQDVFNSDKQNGRWGFYSGFLHVCLLAMGFRFADRSRPDMKSFLRGADGRESSLHTEAKKLAKYEFENPSGLPSVQAFLILADLEDAAGRDSNGWMYVGMATRMAVDLGLNLEASSEALPAQEARVRHLVLCACLTYDRFWALYLGRPPSMKMSDVSVSRLTPIFDPSADLNEQERSHEMQIYEALVELMILSGKITDGIVNSEKRIGSHFLTAAVLEQEFRQWYSALPPRFKWTQENCRNSPANFFLLHQQYHASLVLLHRPFAQYDADHHSSGPTEEEELQSDGDNFRMISRRICYKNAKCVARTFELHQHRFSTGEYLLTGIQQAATAAVALVASIPSLKDSRETVETIRYLQILLNVLKSAARGYQMADRIVKSLDSLLKQHGWDLSTRTTQPIRASESGVPPTGPGDKEERTWPMALPPRGDATDAAAPQAPGSDTMAWARHNAEDSVSHRPARGQKQGMHDNLSVSNGHDFSMLGMDGTFSDTDHHNNSFGAWLDSAQGLLDAGFLDNDAEPLFMDLPDHGMSTTMI